MPRTAKRPLPDGRLTSFEANMFGWVLVLGWHDLPLALHTLVDCLDRLDHVGILCLGLHADEVLLLVEHRRRNDPWCLACDDGLDGSRRRDRCALWLDADRSSCVVAVPSLHVDRLALPRSIRESRLSHAYQCRTNWLSAAWHAIIPAFLLMPVVIYLMHPESPMEWLLACIALAVCAIQLHASWRFLQQRTTQTARTLLRSSLIVLPAIMTMVSRPLFLLVNSYAT